MITEFDNVRESTGQEVAMARTTIEFDDDDEGGITGVTMRGPGGSFSIGHVAGGIVLDNHGGITHVGTGDLVVGVDGVRVTYVNGRRVEGRPDDQ